jgi:ATP-binding cassette subfamily G (WHITE) protein 2 (SNQ2)
VYFGFEALMATEFHNLTLKCSPSDIIPYGAGYNDTRYQSCALAGSTAQSLTVSGDSYLGANFNMRFSYVWRDFGIILIFTISFIVLGAIASEVFSWGGAKANPTIYKNKVSHSKLDEEDGAVEPQHDQSQQIQPDAKAKIIASQGTFTWKGLSYSIGEKVLLNKVDGICAPGEMTALVGSSGAGKTTLLNTLSQRQRVGTVTGELTVNGNSLPSDFRRNAGFVEQTDVHDETATIREAFEFSAFLRQDRRIPREEKLAYVDTVLSLLNLKHLQHAIIGSLQLEQKKRTTIGVELCAKPKLLLFLDEPTSV